MKFGNFEIELIRESSFRLDGGAMFGVVPKTLWSKVSPADDQNRVFLSCNLLLIDTGREKVLEIGTGSGYAAAVLAEIAAQVYTVERIGQLAETAAATLKSLGYKNIHVLHADGSQGWPLEAPYDAIIVTAGGPEVPESLKEQLKIGGRLVIPVGTDPRAQELVRVTRVSHGIFKTEDLADVRFVPLIGKEGWAEEGLPPPPSPGPARRRLAEADIVHAISAAADRRCQPRQAYGPYR